MRYPGTFLDAETHERKYAEVGIHQLAVAQFNLLVGAQQLVHLGNEIRIDMQESVVEYFIELMALFFDKLARLCHAVQFVGLPGGKFASGNLAELIQLVHVDGTQA